MQATDTDVVIVGAGGAGMRAAGRTARGPGTAPYGCDQAGPTRSPQPAAPRGGMLRRAGQRRGRQGSGTSWTTYPQGRDRTGETFRSAAYGSRKPGEEAVKKAEKIGAETLDRLEIACRSARSDVLPIGGTWRSRARLHMTPEAGIRHQVMHQVFNPGGGGGGLLPHSPVARRSIDSIEVSFAAIDGTAPLRPPGGPFETQG